MSPATRQALSWIVGMLFVAYVAVVVWGYVSTPSSSTPDPCPPSCDSGPDPFDELPHGY